MPDYKNRSVFEEIPLKDPQPRIIIENIEVKQHKSLFKQLKEEEETEDDHVAMEGAEIER